LRHQTVDVIRTRLLALVADPERHLLPSPVDASHVRWLPVAPEAWRSPGIVPRHPDNSILQDTVRTSIRTLARGRLPLSVDAVQWLQRNVQHTADDIVDEHTAAVASVAPQVRIMATTPMRTDVPSSSSTAATHPRAGEPPAEDDADSVYEPPESLYEPPGSVDSEGYVSPAATEGYHSDSPAVNSGSEGLQDLSIGSSDVSVCCERALAGVGRDSVGKQPAILYPENVHEKCS